MYFEILIVPAIIIFIMAYNGNISTSQFIHDNEMLFRKLKEDDWDFYVKIILHAIIIVNCSFLLNGTKYYNEDVGVE